MKSRFLLLSLCALLSTCSTILAAELHKDATLTGTNVVTGTITINSGGTATFNGTLAGTPTGGALHLGSVTIDGITAAEVTTTRTATGSVQKTIQSWINDSFVSVDDFGAVGNGSTNDSAAIQAAYNTGRSVVWGSKTYRLSTAISVTAGQQSIGQGAGKTVVLIDDGVDGFTTTANNTGFRFMTVQGNGSTHLAARGIALGTSGVATGNTCNLESVIFRYCTTGFFNSYYDGVSFRNCGFHFNTDNFHIKNNIGAMGMTDCLVSDATRHGLFLEDGANVQMFGGNLNNNGTSGTGNSIYESGGSNFMAERVQFEIVQNATAGAYYIELNSDNGIFLNYCFFQDGGSALKHIHSSGGNSLIRLQGNSVSNNTSTHNKPLVEGFGDIRSADFNGSMHYSGVYYYSPSPWHIYNSSDTLPTAGVDSDNMYQVYDWDGGTGTTYIHTYVKKQVAGTYSYQLIDGTAAGLNAGTAANNLVQLDGSAKLPAVDGSQLTNMPSGGNATVYSTFLPSAIAIPASVTDALVISAVPAGNYWLEFEGGVYPDNALGWKWAPHVTAGTISTPSGKYTSFHTWGGVAFNDDTTFASGEDWAGSNFSGSNPYAFRYSTIVTVSATADVSIQQGVHTGASNGQLMPATRLRLTKIP